MKKFQMLESVVAFTILFSLVGCGNFFGEEISQKISAKCGGQIKIKWRGHDDPGLLVVVEVEDNHGEKIGKDIIVGWVNDAASLGRIGFGLYESRDGNIVGLYHLSEPSLLLVVVDYESRTLYPSQAINPKEYSPDQRRVLQLLSQEAGVDLDFNEYLVIFDP